MSCPRSLRRPDSKPSRPSTFDATQTPHRRDPSTPILPSGPHARSSSRAHAAAIGGAHFPAISQPLPQPPTPSPPQCHAPPPPSSLYPFDLDLDLYPPLVPLISGASFPVSLSIAVPRSQPFHSLAPRSATSRPAAGQPSTSSASACEPRRASRTSRTPGARAARGAGRATGAAPGDSSSVLLRLNPGPEAPALLDAPLVRKPLLVPARVRAPLRARVPPGSVPALPGDDTAPVPLRQQTVSFRCSRTSPAPVLLSSTADAARVDLSCGRACENRAIPARVRGSAVLVQESGEAACIQGGREEGVRRGA
ncbi:hypothetical protein HETIRDRAFT_423633 [Heterobasidion irregulare TC 32-1]|uniref:Uncharacterized protein n=1 Tax=Heterobasidion irregulare (strain TC 32-1) TaxID=747525 RepID=W4JND0_HETIT|nr:uncharacterized protein HETIRDRAFT_423633 [Heterobasidion irregulare TC 32-1]ETW75067.1 hypothetical protein HETIRDRAFT_423633 [Heterobasidion irregulare TC 32-1]